MMQGLLKALCHYAQQNSELRMPCELIASKELEAIRSRLAEPRTK
jgi:hypothetical protein